MSNYRFFTGEANGYPVQIEVRCLESEVMVFVNWYGFLTIDQDGEISVVSESDWKPIGFLGFDDEGRPSVLSPEGKPVP